METKNKDLQAANKIIRKECYDQIESFINKKCFKAPEVFMTTQELKGGIYFYFGAMSQKIISKYMRDRDFKKVRIFYKGRQQACYMGIKLKNRQKGTN